MTGNNGSINNNRKDEKNTPLQILTFTLDADCQTLYGINVFKVKELVTLPRLVKKPNSHKYASGMANIRGVVVPVVDLQHYYGYSRSDNKNILILTEFSGTSQGFIVDEVKTIIHIDWSDVSQPPDAINDMSGKNHGNSLTGISILPDGEMVMLVDLEKIIFEVLSNKVDVVAKAKLKKTSADLKVFFADDSMVARKQISKLLDAMGINYDHAKDGQEAFEMLDIMAKEAASAGKPLSDNLNAIITDIEMPQMDGYALTRKIKADRRFDGIPVMMHSSLSAEQSRRTGNEVGADGFLTKLQPKEFSEALTQLIGVPFDTAA